MRCGNKSHHLQPVISLFLVKVLNILLTCKLLSVAIALGMFATAGAAIAANDNGPSWGYDGKAGASSNWGELKPEYATCKLGLNQSPLDIKGAEVANLDAIKFD